MVFLKSSVHIFTYRRHLEPGELSDIALGYGLDDRGVRVPADTGNFSLHYRGQTGSGAHLASYPMSTGGAFSGVKAAAV
jgi:hypothetical protein